MPVRFRLVPSDDAFFGLFNGKTPDKWGWLEPCDNGASRGVAVAG